MPNLQPTKTVCCCFSLLLYVVFVPVSNLLAIFVPNWQCKFSSKFWFVIEKKTMFGFKVLVGPKHFCCFSKLNSEGGGIQGAGPQIPLNHLTMVIILPLSSPTHCLREKGGSASRTKSI
jgi:hypothetical protein